MDRLTEQQRRRIYEEEKKKEAARRSRASNRRSVGCLVAIGVVLLSMVVIVALARAGALDRFAEQTDAEGGVVDDPPPTRAAAPAEGARTSFGDGAWLVGPEIEPGTYRTDGPSSRCYWALLAEFSNVKAFLDRSEAASKADQGPETGADEAIVVRIRGSEAAFETMGCGTWRRVEGPGQ